MAVLNCANNWNSIDKFIVVLPFQDQVAQGSWVPDPGIECDTRTLFGPDGLLTTFKFGRLRAFSDCLSWRTDGRILTRDVASWQTRAQAALWPVISSPPLIVSTEGFSGGWGCFRVWSNSANVSSAALSPDCSWSWSELFWAADVVCVSRLCCSTVSLRSSGSISHGLLQVEDTSAYRAERIAPPSQLSSRLLVSGWKSAFSSSVLVNQWLMLHHRRSLK